MQIERRAGERDELGGQAHVIGVDVSEQDAANVAPIDREAFERAGQRVEAGFGLHAGIDQQPAGFQANQPDVHDAQGEGKGQFQHVYAGHHFAIIAADFEIGGQGVILA